MTELLGTHERMGHISCKDDLMAYALYHLWSILSSECSWPAFGTVQDHRSGFGTTLRVTGSYPKAGTNSLKRFTMVEFSQLLSDFREASRNFI